MQISDFIGQYQNSVNAGSRIAGGTAGMNQVADTVNKLNTGQLFEGTVTGSKGDQVTLSLSNGQAINARLASDVNLIEGESVFFEVKSNDGNTINIRPVSMGIMNNPTLLSALDAANLPVSENSLNMVKEMMAQQMPIDAAALSNMAKLSNLYPKADIATLVTMQKLNMEITPEMVEQFENYQASEGALMDSVSELANAFVETMADPSVSIEAVKSFQENLLQVIDPEAVTNAPTEENEDVTASSLTDDKGSPLAALTGEETTAEATGSVAGEAEETHATAETGQMTQQAGTIGATGEGSAADVQGIADGKVEAAETHIEILSAADDPEIAGLIEQAGEEPEESYPIHTLGAVMNADEIKELSQTLTNLHITDLPEGTTDARGNLLPTADTTKVLTAITSQIAQSSELSKQDLLKLLQTDTYKGLLKDVLQNKWTLTPEEVADKEKIKELYQDLEKDMARIAQGAVEMTEGRNPISQTAGQIHQNLDFMNQINQTYAYIQLPLRLTGEQATGDLYVYANKKRAIGPDDTVSAFLHFDLEHLGSTDISVKMRNKKVDTKFFMADDASFDLIEKNLPVLQAKLESLGYHATLQVEGGSEPVNFVEDFLKQDVSDAGTITRFSFDMRA